jgi:hypothetical protein
MKHTRKILLSSLMVIGMTFVFNGCVGYVGDGPAYGGGGVWFHDDVWVDGGGRGWYGDHGGNGYVHPGGHDRR